MLERRSQDRVSRLLTFNCHEAYVHLLGKLGLDLDIVDALPGRYTPRWDLRMRPVPARGRLISLGDVQPGSNYDAAIAHNLTDLLALRYLDVPKILVLHVSLAARVAEEPNAPDPSAMQARLKAYLEHSGASAVAVSRAKASSWGLTCPIIRPSADPEEYAGFAGDLPVALRVVNQALVRQKRFGWDDHRAIVEGLPLRLVGHNPELDNSKPAGSWQELLAFYREHRAYVHTAGVGLEDGYNLGLVEAMMTGMPIVSTLAAESPVVDGHNGFVGRDPKRLNACLGALLRDPAQARELGARARETAHREFSTTAFVGGWHQAIERARRQWSGRASPR